MLALILHKCWNCWRCQLGKGLLLCVCVFMSIESFLSRCSSINHDFSAPLVLITPFISDSTSTVNKNMYLCHSWTWAKTTFQSIITVGEFYLDSNKLKLFPRCGMMESNTLKMLMLSVTNYQSLSLINIHLNGNKYSGVYEHVCLTAFMWWLEKTRHCGALDILETQEVKLKKTLNKQTLAFLMLLEIWCWSETRCTNINVKIFFFLKVHSTVWHILLPNALLHYCTVESTF